MRVLRMHRKRSYQKDSHMTEKRSLTCMNIVVTPEQLDALTDLLTVLPTLPPALLEAHRVATTFIDDAYKALSPETIHVCPDCGSDQVQYPAWVWENTHLVAHAYNDGPVEDCWCESCETHVDHLITQEEWTASQSTTTTRAVDIITGDAFDIEPATNVVCAGRSCPQDCDGGPDTAQAYQTSELTVGEWYWIEDEWGNWYVAQAIAGVP